MARGINKVILIGHLGGDPELRYTPDGTPVCNFRMATTERWNSRDGEQREQTEWHTVVAWRRLAEICGEYLSKGRQVYVEGRIRTRSWDDQNGVTQYRTEIDAREVQMLGSREAAGMEEPRERPAAPAAREQKPATQDEDDLPF
jgi:single-strand DNA-binding protein